MKGKGIGGRLPVSSSNSLAWGLWYVHALRK
jgi:hypothetical protein